jgi:hypothetical protein
VVALADRLREEVLSYQGDWQKFSPRVASDMSSGELAALMLYVRDHADEATQEKLGAKWEKLTANTPPLCFVQVYDASMDGWKLGAAIGPSVDVMGGLAVSPDGRHIAYLQAGRQQGDGARLLVWDTRSEGPATHVWELVAQSPVWSADGHFLYYARPAQAGCDASGDQWGYICRTRIVGDSGKMLEPLPSEEKLAHIMWNPVTRLHCLSDGRILFAGARVTLPRAGEAAPDDLTLFVLTSEPEPSVAALFTPEVEQKLPDDQQAYAFIAVCPDEKRFLLPRSDGSAVFIGDLGSGALEEITIPSKSEDHEIGFAPTWRTNDDICVGVSAGSEWSGSKRWEVVLFNLKERKPRAISESWPDELVASPGD